MDIPSMNTQQIRTQVRVPAGKWLLAGVMTNPNAEGKENRLLFFVSADPAEKNPLRQKVAARFERNVRRWLHGASNCFRFLSCAFLATAVAAADAPKEENELRIYDVTELCTPIPDYPGPDPMLTFPQQNPANPVAQNAQPVQSSAGTPTTASLSDMIRQRIAPDQWDAALGTSIEEMAGRLVVMQTPSIHSSIEQLLKSLSTTAKTQVVVKGLLIPAAEIPDQTYFDMPELNKLFDGNAARQAIATPRVVCSVNKQRSHIVSGTEINSVIDMNINGDTHDPVIGTLLDGVVFDVLPILSDDHSNVDVDVRLTWSANVKRHRPRALGLGTGANMRALSPLPQQVSGSTTKDGGSTNSTVNQMLNSQYAIGIEMDMPTMDSGVVRTEVAIPNGKWVLAGTMNNTDPKSEKKNLLLFVNAEPVETK